jgi:hypothetical protein
MNDTNQNTVAIELKVWFGSFGNVKVRENYPNEVQPAAMREPDKMARPSDAMYGVLDELGEEFADAFSGHVYGSPVEVGVLKWFRHGDQSVTYRFDLERKS